MFDEKLLFLLNTIFFKTQTFLRKFKRQTLQNKLLILKFFLYVLQRSVFSHTKFYVIWIEVFTLQ